MAEKEGFEPSLRDYRKHDFESCAFSHSATSPNSLARQIHASITFRALYRRCRRSLRSLRELRVSHSATSPNSSAQAVKRPPSQNRAPILITALGRGKLIPTRRHQKPTAPASDY